MVSSYLDNTRINLVCAESVFLLFLCVLDSQESGKNNHPVRIIFYMEIFKFFFSFKKLIIDSE